MKLHGWSGVGKRKRVRGPILSQSEQLFSSSAMLLTQNTSPIYSNGCGIFRVLISSPAF